MQIRLLTLVLISSTQLLTITRKIEHPDQHIKKESMHSVLQAKRPVVSHRKDVIIRPERVVAAKPKKSVTPPVPSLLLTQLLFNENPTLQRVKQAVAAGANINGTDQFGTTPLMVAACFTNNNPFVSYLIQQGADLTLKDLEGRTAFDYALLGFNPKTIAFLKSKHAPQGTNLFANAINNFNENPRLLTQLLSQKGFNPNQSVGQFGSMLGLLTCADVAVPAAKALLEDKRTQVNQPDPHGITPLMNAAGFSCSKMVQLLLTFGANPNARDEFGMTPLMNVARSTSQEKKTRRVNQANQTIATALLKAGADINAADKHSETALSWAIYSANTAIVTLLCQTTRINPNIAALHNWTPLMAAVNLKNPNTAAHMTRILLQCPGIEQSLNTRNSFGVSALNIAAYIGNPAVVKILCQTRGINPGITDNEGWTPLMDAVAFHNPAVATHMTELLLECPGIEPSLNATNSFGDSALKLAVETSNPSAVKLLCQTRGVNPTIADKQGWTTLMAAAVLENQEIAATITEILLQRHDIELSLNAVNQTSQTALNLACLAGNVSVVKLLCQVKGINPNIADNQGWTPLMNAVSLVSPRLAKETTQALLTCPGISASLNAQNNQGQTALSLAQQYNQSACITLLERAMEAEQLLGNAIAQEDLKGVKKALAMGADPNSIFSISNTSMTALLFSIASNQQPTIVQALLNAGANPNLTNPGNNTPLMLALQQGNLEIARMLLKAEANPIQPNSSTFGSNTPLMYAVTAPSNALALTKLLLTYPTVQASINAVNAPSQQSQTVLILAVGTGSAALVQLIAQIKGVNANVQDSTGMTALMYAAQNNSLPLIKILTAIPDINLNVQNPNGLMALDLTTDQTCINFLTNLEILY